MADKKDPITRGFDLVWGGIVLLILGCIGLTLLVKFLGFILLGLVLIASVWVAVLFYRRYAAERREHEIYRRTHP